MSEPQFDFISTATAAGRLKVSEQTIRRMMKRGQLPAYRLGNAVRIKTEDLEAVMKPWQRKSGAA